MGFLEDWDEQRQKEKMKFNLDLQCSESFRELNDRLSRIEQDRSAGGCAMVLFFVAAALVAIALFLKTKFGI